MHVHLYPSLNQPTLFPSAPPSTPPVHAVDGQEDSERASHLHNQHVPTSPATLYPPSHQYAGHSTHHVSPADPLAHPRLGLRPIALPPPITDERGIREASDAINKQRFVPKEVQAALIGDAFATTRQNLSTLNPATFAKARLDLLDTLKKIAHTPNLFSAVLSHLTLVLRLDPLSEESSHHLTAIVKYIIENLNIDQSQHYTAKIRRQLIEAHSYALITLHLSFTQARTVINQELLEEIGHSSRACLKNFTRDSEDVRLTIAKEWANQATIRIESNFSLGERIWQNTERVASGVIRLANAGAAASSYATPGPGHFSVVDPNFLQAARKDITSGAAGAQIWARSWFDQLLNIHREVHQIIKDPELATSFFQTVSNMTGAPDTPVELICGVVDACLTLILRTDSTKVVFEGYRALLYLALSSHHVVPARVVKLLETLVNEGAPLVAAYAHALVNLLYETRPQWRGLLSKYELSKLASPPPSSNRLTIGPYTRDTLNQQEKLALHMFVEIYLDTLLPQSWLKTTPPRPWPMQLIESSWSEPESYAHTLFTSILSVCTRLMPEQLRLQERGEGVLHRLVRGADSAKLSLFLTHCKEFLHVDERDKEGLTPLHLAMALPQQQELAITQILAAYANPNIADDKGDTWLHHVAHHKEPARQQALLTQIFWAHPPHVHAYNRDCETPLISYLHHAASIDPGILEMWIKMWRVTPTLGIPPWIGIALLERALVQAQQRLGLETSWVTSWLSRIHPPRVGESFDLHSLTLFNEALPPAEEGQGNSPLHYAGALLHAKAYEKLLIDGNPLQRNAQGQIPLSLALYTLGHAPDHPQNTHAPVDDEDAQTRFEEIVDVTATWLHAEGLHELQAADEEGWTILHEAALYAQPHQAKLLIRLFPHLFLVGAPLTPLEYACYFKRYATAKAMLTEWLEHTQEQSPLPTLQRALTGSTQLAELLVQLHGPESLPKFLAEYLDAYDQANTPFTLSLQHQVIAALITCGDTRYLAACPKSVINPTMLFQWRDEEGNTLLHLSLTSHEYATAHRLLTLAHSLSPSHPQILSACLNQLTIRGESLLDRLIARKSSIKEQELYAVVQALRALNYTWQTPFHTIIHHHDLQLLEVVINVYKELPHLIREWLYQRNGAGQTPLFIALFYNHSAIIGHLRKLIHDHPSRDPHSLTVDSSGCSLLHLAAQWGLVAELPILSQEGYSLQAVDRWGNSPLHYAAAHHQTDYLAQALLQLPEKEITDQLLNVWGQTPLHKALEALYAPIIPTRNASTPSLLPAQQAEPLSRKPRLKGRVKAKDTQSTIDLLLERGWNLSDKDAISQASGWEYLCRIHSSSWIAQYRTALHKKDMGVSGRYSLPHACAQYGHQHHLALLGAKAAVWINHSVALYTRASPTVVRVTPLALAIIEGHWSCARYLAAQSTIKAVAKEDTPLHFIARHKAPLPKEAITLFNEIDGRDKSTPPLLLHPGSDQNDVKRLLVINKHADIYELQPGKFSITWHTHPKEQHVQQ